MKQKRILFVGHSMSPYAPAIINALQKLNYQVTYFDHFSPDLKSKFMGLINNYILSQSRLGQKKLTEYINESLIKTAKTINSDYIFIYKGKNLSKRTLQNLKKIACVINWYPDYFDDWYWIKTHAALFDYFFTPCLYVQKKLKELKIKSFYLPFAATADKTYANYNKIYQTTFVGRWTKRREKLFKKVLDAGLLDIWGYFHWQKTKYQHIYHGEVHPTKVPRIIRQSKITLNTVTCEENIPIESVNYRVFEVTGLGGFLLTWYNHPLEHFFDPGREIVIFHTPEEALEKTKYYLKHDHTREKIARAGWKKTSQQHTYKVRLKQMFAQIN